MKMNNPGPESYRQHIQKNRQFGLLVGSVLGLISVYIYWQKASVNLFLMVPALLLGLLAVVWPTVLTSVRIAWEKLGMVLGIINSYIILTVIFVCIFIPYGLLLRLLRKDILGKRLLPTAKTYWQKKEDWGQSMKHQF